MSHHCPTPHTLSEGNTRQRRRPPMISPLFSVSSGTEILSFSPPLGYILHVHTPKTPTTPASAVETGGSEVLGRTGPHEILSHSTRAGLWLSAEHPLGALDLIPSTGKTNFSSVEKQQQQLENVSTEGTWTSNVVLKLGLNVSLPTSYPGLFSHSSNQYQRISASQA